MTAPVRVGLRLWEIVLLSLVIQWGMMPLLARDFHRVSLTGPLSNIPAVVLTGLIVPLGFLTLVATFVWARLALALGKVLGYCAGMLLATVEWFSRLPHASYRIPEPPIWLLLAFFAALVFLVMAVRAAAARRMNRIARRQLPPPIAPAEWISALALAAAHRSRRVASVSARDRARQARSERSRCGAGRFDLRRVSRRPHDADRRRRPCRLGVGGRISLGHGRRRRSRVAVSMVARA